MIFLLAIAVFQSSFILWETRQKCNLFCQKKNTFTITELPRRPCIPRRQSAGVRRQEERNATFVS